VSRALAPEGGHRRGDAVQHAAQVDVDHRGPGVDVAVGQRADLADAGVADQDVDAAELRDRARHQLVQVGAARDVGAAGDHPRAPVAQLAGDGVQPLGAPGAQGHDGAPFRQQPGGGLADAAARPGDGHDLAGDA
jgi:hypothetical protein